MDFQHKRNRYLSLRHCQMIPKTPEKREHFAFGLIVLEIQRISTMSLRMSETGKVSCIFTISLMYSEYRQVLINIGWKTLIITSAICFIELPEWKFNNLSIDVRF